MTDRIDPALRAAACARLRAVAEADGLSVPAEASYPDLVRSIYERSALPVREIAGIAGTTERTLYKWVQQGGWGRRNWRHARYSGGRVVRAGEAAFPDAGGSAALDPQAAGVLAADYAKARRLVQASGAAMAAAAQERDARRAAASIMRATDRSWKEINRVLEELCTLKEQGAKADDPRRLQAERVLDRLMDMQQWLLEQRPAQET